MSTPQLHLETLFVLNEQGGIVSTREPGATRGPLFFLARGMTGCAWAVHADVPPALADQLEDLATQEPPASDLWTAPVHAVRYRSLWARGAESAVEPLQGMAFTFPEEPAQPNDVPDGIVLVEDERLLARHFSGWMPGEIAAGRAPVLAITDGGFPVSVCFCARRSDAAAEAGVETAAAHRGRGLAPRVTAAWVRAIRESGRVPLYSTSWTNDASLAVARKLGLVAYASTWSLAG